MRRWKCDDGKRRVCEGVRRMWRRFDGEETATGPQNECRRRERGSGLVRVCVVRRGRARSVTVATVSSVSLGDGVGGL